MKKSLLFILLTCACIYTQAQVNYVLNPSFELYDTCPWMNDQIQLAKYWEPIDTLANPDSLYSYDALCSPEYCNSCAALTSYVSVPQGEGYYHYAHSGNGMAQELMYNDESDIAITGPYQRDYLQGHLYKSLTTGKSYCVTFYVALEQFSGYAINHIGAYFDDGSIDTTIATETDCARPQTAYIPQVVEDSIIIDTLGWSFINDSSVYDRTWVKIQGSFTATGTERFITIGNFFDVANTDTILLPYFNSWIGAPGGPITWYLVDDVSVIESDNLPDAGNDTAIVKGDSVFLGPHEIALPYWWYVKGNSVAIDSGGGIWVKPDSSTTYILEQNLCGVLNYDSVTVSVLPKNNSVVNVGNVAGVVVYPNPANDFVNVQMNNVQMCKLCYDGEVKIFNVVGQEVGVYKIVSNKQTLDISNLKAGVYFLQITAGDGSVVNKIIEKE